MKEYSIIYPKWFDFYAEPENVDEWESCSNCDYKPRIWSFNNGRHAACACASGYSRYDHKIISCESIGDLVRRENGDITNYDSDLLRKTWNNHVKSILIKQCRKNK